MKIFFEKMIRCPATNELEESSKCGDCPHCQDIKEKEGISWTECSFLKDNQPEKTIT